MAAIGSVPPLAPVTLPRPSAATARRSWRVVGLTIAIALMSLVDLYITLLYVRSVGMGEANPLARWVIEHFSIGMLVAWKCLTIVTACSIFAVARRTKAAEFGAWVCCAVLVWLTLRWTAYSHEVTHLTPVLHMLSHSEAAKWVSSPD
jgi:hypothetical protein